LHLDRLEERLLLSPTITSLSPNSAVEGSNSALLAVIGSGFQTGATVYWNGAALSTTLVSSSELQATIPAIDIAEEESESISVANPDGRASITMGFTVLDAPLSASGVNFVATKGEYFTTVVATFTDAAPNQPPSDYSAGIDWGDGSTSAYTPFTIISNSNGGFNVGASHGYAATGSYTVTVTIADRGGSTALAVSAATVRLFNAGDLDPTFGPGGVASTDFPEVTNPPNVVLAQADGKAVMAESTALGHIALARFNPDGTLDTGFGVGGHVITDFSAVASVAAGAMAPDGKIVIVGERAGGFGVRSEFALARYNPDGSLDPGFGSGGEVVTRVGTSSLYSDASSDVVVQADGKIVVAGYELDPNLNIVSHDLIRYNTDGSLDETFASGGIANADFGYYLALQPDGRIVVAGDVNHTALAVARYSSNGSPDISFGVGGEVTANFGRNTFAGDVALEADGTIVVAGRSGPDLVMLRYNFDGTADTSFGTGGQTAISSIDTGYRLYSNALAVQADGRIVIAGESDAPGPNVFQKPFIVRFDSDGTLDPTFNSNGTQTYYSLVPQDMALQGDGKILLATYSGIARLLTNDSPPTMTTVVSSQASSVYGDGVSFTASVRSSGSPVASGTVTFLDNGTPVDTQGLDSGGHATFTSSAFAVTGSPHTITARYNGDTTNSGSLSSGIALSVTKATITVTANIQSRTYGTDNPLLTAGFSGFVHGETLATSGVSGSPILMTTADNTSPAGSYPITAALGALAAGNYDFRFVGGTLTVNNPVPTLTSLSRTAATEDTAGMTLSVTGTGFVPTSQARWNGLPLATTLVSGTQLQATIPTAYLAEEGVFAIGVFNPGPGGGFSATQTFTVIDAPITASGLKIVATQGSSFTGPVAVLSDANPGANAGDFTATIFWGDGQSSAAAVNASGIGNFIVAGAHTYTAEGRYTVQVTVIDVGGSQATTTSLAHVARTGPKPGGLPIAAAALTHSAEHYSLFVTNAYQLYLGRAPDLQGLAGWVSAMQNGLTDERLEAGFISSMEYIQRNGGLGAGWIRAMYQNLLNRTPSDSEVSAWAAALDNGVIASDVAYLFATSPEREGIRVRADYQSYLGRTASDSEVNGWVQAFEGNRVTSEDVVAGFIGSAEYFQTHYDNAADWLFSAYNDMLGRNPDDASYAAWLAYLRN
jgi:uncharacterized delta-60 repeat protein